MCLLFLLSYKENLQYVSYDILLLLLTYFCYKYPAVIIIIIISMLESVFSNIDDHRYDGIFRP